MTLLSTNDTMAHQSATLCPADKLYISSDHYRAYLAPQGPYYHRLIRHQELPIPKIRKHG